MTSKQLIAHIAEGETHRLWTRWRDSEVPETRRMALKAKAHGVVAWDRIMRSGQQPKGINSL